MRNILTLHGAGKAGCSDVLEMCPKPHLLRAENAKLFTETEHKASQVGRRGVAGGKRFRVQEA